MLKAFKYRLYPTNAQADKINQTIGCARLVYNLMLNAKIEHYKETKKTLHIGIDLGLHDFIVCSDGQRIEAPKHFIKAEQKLAKRQRAFAKTVKDSKNHEKMRVKVAKCHQKIKNQRKDFLQKLSTKLINENQVISLEDLSVKSMESNHCIAKSVADASFSMFVNMLEYKAKWYGRTIVRIDRFYPSTQICSGCGFQNKTLKGMKGLRVREWVCPCCGEFHDRDLNASRNIDREGLKKLNRWNDGASSLTVHQTSGLVSVCDVLAREAHEPLGRG